MTDKHLTVVCLKWEGWRPYYEACHVNVLGRMLQRYLKLPHRFVCITDDAAGITEAETFPLWDDPIVPNKPSHHDTYRRLKLFSAWAAEEWPGWLLSIDLDTIILRDITDLITWPDTLRILKGAVSRYRAGLFLHRTGSLTHVWESFDPVESPKLYAQYTTKGKPWKGSDQVWISIQVPYADLYTQANGIYVWSSKLQAQDTIPPKAKIVFPIGPIKPWHETMRTVSPCLYDAYMKWM